MKQKNKRGGKQYLINHFFKNQRSWQTKKSFFENNKL